MVSHNSTLYILQTEAISFSFLEINRLLHIFAKVALIILKQDEFEVEMTVIQGGKTLYYHFELATIIQLDLLIYMYGEIP